MGNCCGSDKPQPVDKKLQAEQERVMRELRAAFFNEEPEEPEEPEKPALEPSDPNLVFQFLLKENFGGRAPRNIKIDMQDKECNEKLKKVQTTHIAAVSQMLKNDFHLYLEEFTTDFNERQAQCIKAMKRLNTMNWQYFLLEKDKEGNYVEKALPDFESI